MKEDVHIHGGVITFPHGINNAHIHGGVIYLKGYVEKVISSGGIIYDQRNANRVVYQIDKVSEEERQKYLKRISNLENRLRKSENECLKLQAKIGKNVEEIPPDDVLVQKINHLQIELDQERKVHSKELQELRDRLDVAMEINAKLRAHNKDVDRRSQEIAENHIDILATLMSLYPFTPDKDLEFEFGIPANKIRDTAKVLGQIKSSDARREAVEYLRKQHIDFIQRRGGDRGNHTYAKVVEKVSKNGRLLTTFRSAKEAGKSCGMCDKTVRDYCTDYHKKRRYTKEGYTFRYKQTKN